MFVISTPSSRMVPSVGCSNPAISRSVVVFPQPEGPSKEKNSPLSTVRSTWSTAMSVKRFVSATSSILPPAIAPTYLSLPIRPHATRDRGRADRGLAVRLPARPVAGNPGEAQLPGREAHGQLERPPGVHRGVLQGDLNREPVQQRRQRGREVGRADRAELARLLPLQDQGGDRVPPALVELLPHGGHLGVARRLRPQVEPEQP